MFSEDLNDGPPRISARLGPLARASLGHSWSTFLSYGGGSGSGLRPNVTYCQDNPITWLCQGALLGAVLMDVNVSYHSAHGMLGLITE